MADHTKEPCLVKPCSCHHPYQDSIYGKGMRLHNPFKKDNDVGYRCTVCGMNPKKPWNFVEGRLVISPAYRAATDSLMKATTVGK